MESGIVYSESPQSGKVRLQLRGGLTESAIKEVRDGKYDILWLYYGNFEAMSKLPLDKICGEVKLQCSESQDISWVGMLSSIDTLSVRGKVKGKIDFTNMQALKRCDLDWCAATRGVISSGLKLSSLGLSKFSGLLEDFSDETAHSLYTLGLTGSINTLNGIGRFINLREVSLWNMRKLQDISELELCKELTCLQIEGCNVVDYKSVLKNLLVLEDLFFENNELDSLSSLPKESLKKVVLGDKTKILDGNVESFLDFPKLERVSYTKKKGYKYSGEELDKLLKKRIG